MFVALCVCLKVLCELPLEVCVKVKMVCTIKKKKENNYSLIKDALIGNCDSKDLSQKMSISNKCCSY